MSDQSNPFAYICNQLIGKNCVNGRIHQPQTYQAKERAPLLYNGFSPPAVTTTREGSRYRNPHFLLSLMLLW
ncbi:Hypothetical predicted protein [Octopus vulgaris]|uniref:Uncharacterized protein n=1 Tax=Octopus vulgaris TaxID=6645 RepID=A0AA36BQY2_OCTVU|nr:Hypothetical predicted protein [Octopus vulgaris]